MTFTKVLYLVLEIFYKFTTSTISYFKLYTYLLIHLDTIFKAWLFYNLFWTATNIFSNSRYFQICVLIHGRLFELCILLGYLCKWRIVIPGNIQYTVHFPCVHKLLSLFMKFISRRRFNFCLHAVMCCNCVQ